MLPLTTSEFVAELARRWQDSHPAEPAGATPQEPPQESGSRDIPAGAIFVSYLSDNRDAADRLTEGLRAAGLQVWFDKDALQMGDDWLRGIRRGIERCSLFVPVISREALGPENRRRFFWREWMEADDFARGMAPGEVFIVPVMIDDTRIDRVDVPDSFKKAQGRVLPDGKVAPEVAESLKHLVRDFHRRRA